MSPFLRYGKTLFTAFNTIDISHDSYSSSLFGVGTDMIKASASAGFVETFKVPFSSTSSNTSCKPGSSMFTLPFCKLSIVLSLISTPNTSTSCLANIIDVGNPIYPNPTTVNFILIPSIKHRFYICFTRKIYKVLIFIHDIFDNIFKLLLINIYFLFT